MAYTDEQLAHIHRNKTKAAQDTAPVGPSVSSLGEAISRSLTGINFRTCACGERHDERLFIGDLCVHCVQAANALRLNKIRMGSESGIDKRHEHLRTWDDLLCEVSADAANYQTTLKAFRGFLNNKIGSVVAFIGDRGNGKTGMASVGVRMAIDRGMPGRITQALLLIDNLNARFNTKSTNEDWMDEWREPWLLVIDELQEVNDSQWSATRLTTLIDRRYADMKKTVIIANLMPTEFKKLAGKSIVDRACEGGGVLLFDWPSFRPKIQEM